MMHNLIKSLTHIVKRTKPTIKEMVVKMWNNGFDLTNIAEFINKSYKTTLNVDVIEGIIKDSKTIVINQELFGYLNEINNIVKRLKKNLEVSKYDINMIKMYSDIIASNILDETTNN